MLYIKTWKANSFEVRYPKDEELKYAVYTIDGKLIFSDKARTNQQIDLQELSGIFVVKIETDGLTHLRKLFGKGGRECDLFF
mgnify:CR=1 FL=1